MRYRGGLSVPAGTVALSPVSATVVCCPGIITEVEIIFPAGSGGGLYGQIVCNGRVIFPSSPDMAFRGDDTHITFSDAYALTDWPYEIELRGWAPDTELSHTFFVEVSVRPFDAEVGFGSVPVGLPEGFE